MILIILFWAWRLRSGDPRGPAGLKHLNDRFKKLTPWQIAVTLLTCLYGIRHWDILLGLSAPEPLARLYSRGFYRATWINTALDAGFATAGPIPFKWLRDLLSLLFSGYYLIYANEADEKLRRYRAVPTVEVLRITWEKTTNPIIQFFTRHNRPPIPIKRKYVFPRPPGSKYTRPIACWLYYSGSDLELVRTKNLILDVPGGGFIAMSPLHHEDRIIQWTLKTGIPILSIDYCKAPEYPFPYAIHECMDVYRLIQESKGRIIGMGRDQIDIVLTGDSAGANLAAAMIVSIIESDPHSPFHSLSLPVGVLWLYAALDFNFTSWMSPENLRILRRGNSSTKLPEGILEAKSHLNHKSPLSVVDDRVKFHEGELTSRGMQKQFRKSIANLPNMMATWKRALTPKVERSLSEVELSFKENGPGGSSNEPEEEEEQDQSSPFSPRDLENEKSLGERVLFHDDELARSNESMSATHEGALQLGADSKDTHSNLEPRARAQRKAFGTHLTMTSRTGFFNDRIISPSMMRCMAICYIGPRNSPDLTKDYHISPIFTPSDILARFPPVYLVCGEKDPFVDDTVIIAGKIREAKQQRKREALAKLGTKANDHSEARADPILEEAETDWVQMRIFEGWSHGFAQMLPLLPEVGAAFDLTSDFILSAFKKHDLKASAKSTTLQVPSLNPSGSGSRPKPRSPPDRHDDDALTFTPRLRPRADTGSRPGSPLPHSRTNNKTSRPAVPHWQSSSTSPTQRPSVPSLRVSPSKVDSAPVEVDPSTPKSGIASSSSIEAIPKSMLIDFNVATAAAIVTPPVLPTVPATVVSTRREGNVLDDHHDLLNRRREEAGYGLPAMKTPEEHFKPLELSSSYVGREGRLAATTNESRGQYVEEQDLFERRRKDATYGITPTSPESHSSSSDS